MKRYGSLEDLLENVAGDVRVVHYDRKHWCLLEELRREAITVMEVLRRFSPILHGSVARGDVREDSDVDIFLLNVSAPSMAEALLRQRFDVASREIVLATPFYVVKGIIELPRNIVVSFPFSKLTDRERLFYKFGGELTLEELRRGIRVPGCNKELKVVVPTKNGHIEFPLEGNEVFVARLLDVDLETISERVRVLKKRKEMGRTGLFYRRILRGEETFEEAFLTLRKELSSFRIR